MSKFCPSLAYGLTPPPRLGLQSHFPFSRQDRPAASLLPPQLGLRPLLTLTVEGLWPHLPLPV